MSKLNRLTSEEMRQAMILFTECQKNVYDESIEDDKIIIDKWISYSVLAINPCYSLRPDALNAILSNIFADSRIRDFCFDLAFRFFSTWGDHNDSAHRLSKNIAEGLALDGPDTSLSVIPQTILTSMAQTVFSEIISVSRFPWLRLSKNPVAIEDFLHSNKHLLVVYMLYLTNTNATNA